MICNTTMHDFGKRKKKSDKSGQAIECKQPNARGPELSQALQWGHKALRPLLAAQTTRV